MIIIIIIFILSLVYCNYYVSAHLNIYIYIYIYRICALEVNKLLLLFTNLVFKPIKGEVNSKV